MPSRRKHSHSDEPHCFSCYNESPTINNNQQQLQFKKSISQSYYEINNIADDYDDDIWSKDDLLYKDNLREVLNKWENLDDGIWSKIICLEHNRRVAKAYARFKKLTINGSDCCFDGQVIGLKGFENPFRNKSTANVLSSIGSNGLTIKIDGEGNIWVQHNCHCSVFAPQCNNHHSHRSFQADNSSTAVGRELENCSGHLSANKWFKLFDMSRFRDNVIKEMSSNYPDMASLQFQCISVISFGSKSADILESPSSILIINILALDMLRTRLCPKSESTSKPIKESLKNVAGSVWQSVRRLASRSSKRHPLTTMLDRSWRSTSKVFKDENPYSSLTSSALYADANYYNDNYGEIRAKDDPLPRLSYLSGVNQFRISTIDTRLKGSPMFDYRPKPEPMPDYDNITIKSSSSLSSAYKGSNRKASLAAVSNDGYDDWTNLPAQHKPSFYPQTRLSGPLNSVFRAFPIDTPIVDSNCNQSKDQPEGSTISSTDSNSCDVSTASPETESNDEAESHIYSSISDSKDGKSINQSKSDGSESSDQYGEIKTIDDDEDDDEDNCDDQVDGIKENKEKEIANSIG